MATNLIAAQTAIPNEFGHGGANLSGEGASGKPSLKDLLTEYKTALAALDSQALQKRTVTVLFGDLAAGNSNGAAVSVNIGAVLPANARIDSVALKLTTPFTGGSATAVKCDVGTSGDAVAVVNQADVFAAAVDGYASTMPAGKAPNKQFVTAGAQLLAKFTPDASHQLVNLTGGAATIDVLFRVLA